MKKIGKILLLIACISLLCVGIWSFVVAVLNFIYVSVGQDAVLSIATLVVGGLTLLFVLQSAVSGIKMFAKGNNKDFKKALVSSIIILILVVFDLIAIGVNVAKIFVLAIDCLLIAGAFITKFSK